MDGPLLWYLNRATGTVLLAVLTVTVLLGIVSGGTTGPRPGWRLPRFVTQTLHRNIALLAVLLLCAHVATAVVDTYVDIHWWHALIPVGARYQPWWLGLGTVSLDLLAAITITSLLRSRLPLRVWRSVHLLSYVAWAVAVAHGVGIGTDMTAEDRWGLAVAAVCVALVLLAGAWRLNRPVRRPDIPVRSAA